MEWRISDIRGITFVEKDMIKSPTINSQKRKPSEMIPKLLLMPPKEPGIMVKIWFTEEKGKVFRNMEFAGKYYYKDLTPYGELPYSTLDYLDGKLEHE